ncbi:hypothetical protein POUND7_005147 [Theobroma cacao]
MAPILLNSHWYSSCRQDLQPIEYLFSHERNYICSYPSQVTTSIRLRSGKFVSLLNNYRVEITSLYEEEASKVSTIGSPPLHNSFEM